MATRGFHAAGLLVFSVLFLLVVSSVANEDYDGQVSLVVQHSLDQGTSPSFTNRGTIMVRSVRNGIVSISQDIQLKASERAQLKEIAQSNGIYRLRVLTKPGDESSPIVSTFIKACSLYESQLSDRITLHVDQSADVYAVSLDAPVMLCSGDDILDSSLTTFNTTIEIKQMENGPMPDTASYIQKIEKQKAEKAKGEFADNRSFFAKYDSLWDLSIAIIGTMLQIIVVGAFILLAMWFQSMFYGSNGMQF